MRAAQSQAVLAALERFPPSERREILARFGARGVEEVRSALPLSWLPMEVHMHLSDSLRDVSGSDAAVRAFREAMTMTFDRPLLRSFVSLTTGIFGVSPQGLLKRGDRVYEQVTRNAGALSHVALGERECEVHLVGFPAKLFTFDCYVDGLRGCLLASLDLCKAKGSVEVLARDARGDVSYVLRWGS